MFDSNEVVFVFLGNNLPKYAQASLKLSLSYSGLKVHLIANKRIKANLDNDQIKISLIEDFYDETAFRKVSEKLTLPSEFRDGFWLKTLERFFVLNQFMNKNSVKEIFHAELDQLLFRCDLLVENLSKSPKKGLFMPFHGENKAVASVFYCNNRSDLNSFINFASEIRKITNEMELFAFWAKTHPEKLTILPTIKSEEFLQKFLDSYKVSSLTSAQIGGVVDAALIGQWVAGEDPRNLPLSTVPRNKYYDFETSRLIHLDDLSRLELRLLDNKELYYTLNLGESNRLFNLHIHSKIHSWLSSSDENVKKLIYLSNNKNSITLPTTRAIQIKNVLNNSIESFVKNPKKVLANRVVRIFSIFFK